jgi:hypothetical protein
LPDTDANKASPQEIGSELARIQTAVEGGATDLAGLGFWRLVERLKSDPALAGRFADTAGRIDRTAFERRVRPRFPVWFGNAVLGTGVALGGALLGWAVTCDEPVQAAIGLITGAGVLSVSAHDLGHWVAGRLAGIRFTSYFLDGPFRIQPGLKTDYASYLRASPRGRARMHATGALASKAAPFVALAIWPATVAPGWAALAVLGLGLLQIATDLIWSTKKSDWKKYARERRTARLLYS